MDLREEIKQLIEEKGHYILLHRTSRKIRCICWNEKFKEADPCCPRCLGEGWVSRIERHKVRRDNASQIVSMPNLIRQTPISQVASDARVFYMLHNTHPKAGDMVYEVGWDRKRPTHLIKSYEINAVEDLREEGGRIEYYNVVVRERNVDTRVKGITIRHLGPVQNYELIRGGQ